MRLATVSASGEEMCAAVLSDDRLLSLSKAARHLTGPAAEALKANSMLLLIGGPPETLDVARGLVGDAEAGSLGTAILAEGAKLLAPIPAIRKNVLCVGRNYAEHIAEGDRAQKQKVGVTEYPVFFTKPPTSIVGPGGDVLTFPSISKQTDYEVELAVIIGTPGRNIARADAMKHVFGYTILNDISARDVQRRHGGQNFKGKAFDGSCPMGPWIVTADAIDDPHALPISLTVNGETRQDGNTRDMIFDIETLIASLSEGMTLEPGDIIATGTPSGVGYAMDPPCFLKDGDSVVCNISGIGTLTNSVRAV
ncbi:fumarylacetoacetate hydrolase family protein [uncultured Roseibium sp.]|uniref:fumarylacetoacetate hydrolase family protein n=1 Tax=uncultured Roseibium sp. TaxID=1936171 RepID=UPI0026119932|nr:fumarylacetoacetate hydrolase family protein [uncultured Roseibium sp.]